MAIAFARFESVKKSLDWSARDKLDYIARRRKWTDRRDLLAGPIQILPACTPRELRRPEKLWAAADAAEKFGQIVAHEIVIALPNAPEASDDEAVALARLYAQTLVHMFGIAITLCLHDGESNRHAHLLVTSRSMTPSGLAPRRNRALLPTCRGGRVVDGVDFAGLYRTVLNGFFAAQSRAVRARPVAPVPGYHVGPVAGIGALIADAEAIARRQDAEAIFRKISRMRLNTKIEAGNSEAVRDRRALLTHLSVAPFERTDLEQLIDRFVADPIEAADIIRQTLLGARELKDPVADQALGLFVTPDFAAAEHRLIEMGRALSPGGQRRLEAPDLETALSAVAMSTNQLIVLELERNDACVIGTVLERLQDRGPAISLATRLGKTGEVGAGARLHPLHWNIALAPRPGELIVLDDADAAPVADLTKLLQAADETGARVLLIRRPSGLLYRRNPSLDALAASLACVCLQPENALSIETALRRSDYDALVAGLGAGGRLKFAPSRADMIAQAVAEARSSLARGVRLHFLCASVDLNTALTLRLGNAGAWVTTGPVIPVDHHGPVILLHTPAPADRSILAQLRGRRFAVLSEMTATPDQDALARQLMFLDGHATPALVTATAEASTTSGSAAEGVLAAAVKLEPAFEHGRDHYVMFEPGLPHDAEFEMDVSAMVFDQTPDELDDAEYLSGFYESLLPADAEDAASMADAWSDLEDAPDEDHGFDPFGADDSG